MNVYRSLYLRWIGAAALGYTAGVIAAAAVPIQPIFLVTLLTAVLQYFLVLRLLKGLRNPILWPLAVILAISFPFAQEYVFKLHSVIVWEMGVFLYFVFSEAALALMFRISGWLSWSVTLILSYYLLYAICTPMNLSPVGYGSGVFDFSSFILAPICGSFIGAGTGLAILFTIHRKQAKLKKLMGDKKDPHSLSDFDIGWIE